MGVDVSRLGYKFEFPSPVSKSNMVRQHAAVDVCDTPHNLNLVSSGGNNPPTNGRGCGWWTLRTSSDKRHKVTAVVVPSSEDKRLGWSNRSRGGARGPVIGSLKIAKLGRGLITVGNRAFTAGVPEPSRERWFGALTAETGEATLSGGPS
jgi:hypothetical protein